ncbi:hypothetical protein [Mucilaginibacter gilvus]|uniref:Uncharacterized protein n=1 Tax=Mucilaginibacter gilvus TaxID=2305909 RepID=A0A444MIC0_9SPHI|nr:hypothetical protein [Mucilaginibacter gilvus]RWY47854.1 hypothetical protein EPL05_19880 [Mucilaginibacter gilvus]
MAGFNIYTILFFDGEIRFESDATDKAGNKTLFHFTFFNQGQLQLRQLLEQSPMAAPPLQ